MNRDGKTAIVFRSLQEEPPIRTSVLLSALLLAAGFGCSKPSDAPAERRVAAKSRASKKDWHAERKSPRWRDESVLKADYGY